jgi:predicted  nucleic acid-binding Zn-ribbon protein
VTRISNLFRLQTLDSQIDSLQARLAEIENALSRHPELDQARTAENEARHQSESARQVVRQAEEETRRQQQKLKETEQSLYGGAIVNPKELQDIQEETLSLRKFLAVLEDRQLQSMILLEEIEKAVAAAQDRCRELEEVRSKDEQRLSADRSALQSSLETIRMQQEAAASEILAEDLEKYSALRRTKHGVAVVRMEGGSCSGCGVAPSSARMDSARSGQEIVPCGNCGRILYMG